MIDLFKDLFRDKTYDKERQQYYWIQVNKVMKWAKPFSEVLRKNLIRFVDECEKDKCDSRAALVMSFTEVMFHLRTIRLMMERTGADMEKVDLVMIDIIRKGDKSDYWIQAMSDAKKAF